MNEQLAQAIVTDLGAALDRRLALGAVRAVGGGDINQAAQLDCEYGRLFVKYRQGAEVEMYAAEAAALTELKSTQTVPTATPVRYGAVQGYGFLLLEWLPLSSRDAGADYQLGRALAELHRVEQPHYGWHRDNFIGATAQANTPHDDWMGFFASQRLRPQLELLGQPDLSTLGEQLIAQLSRWFADYQPQPSLLHGDLWSGNAAATADGQPVIYDPASYYGDREAELAMCDLFGGFSAAFYRGYDEVWPRAPGYRERRSLYQLYHLLNHANLFGGGYLSRCGALLRQLID